MTTRVTDLFLDGDHASRPAETDVPVGTLYSCTTHNLVYKNEAGTWTTWASLGGTGVQSIVAGANITVDNTDPQNPEVSASGGGATDALTPGSLHATYGDHFTGSSLDAKWTRVTYASGDETYQVGAGGSWMQTAARTTGAYYYQTFSGGTSDFTLVMKTVWYAVVGSQMFGLIAVDNNGAGVAGGWYNSTDDAPIVAHLNNGIAYDSGNVALQSPKSGPRGTVIGYSGLPCWYKLTRSGNTWKTALSLNGQVWSQATSPITVSFTPTRIGFGNFQASTTTIPGGCLIDFFDVQ